MQQVNRAVFRRSDFQVVVETANPSDQNPEDDKDQQSRTDGVHDGLEMTLVFGSLNETSGASDERVLC